jgi:hypothetical protein
MSEQQVERLQALLETVQRNRQRPGQPIGGGAVVSAASVVQNKSPANMTEPSVVNANVPPAADTTRIRNPVPAEAPTAPIAAPLQSGAGAPVAARRDAQPQAQTTPKAGPPARVQEPAPSQTMAEPMVPRMIEPDAPRALTRPIAQLVSKHAPVVDATFGAMLKRSLSLRPQ